MAGSHCTTKYQCNNKHNSEYARLKKELQKEISHTEELQLSLSSLQQHNSKLTQELEEIKINHGHFLASSLHVGDGGGKREAELLVRPEKLQAGFEKKTLMLMDVKKQLMEASERERSAMPTDSQV